MSYFDNAGRLDVLGGGVRMLPVTTPAGTHRVWTKRTGNNTVTKLLLLHGGPGATHEYLLAFDSFLPAAGVEYDYYDQLGSGWSDRPDDPSLWTIDRFVDEVEQVRLALSLASENFILYGQSWGALLAIEYALAHPQHLKGLVISNMMASIPAYNRYAADVLIPAHDPGKIGGTVPAFRKPTGASGRCWKRPPERRDHPRDRQAYACPECDAATVENGVVTSHRFYFDMMDWLKQLGLAGRSQA
jgi:pimeloyl-ACP methyl ester carboxylesterase